MRNCRKGWRILFLPLIAVVLTGVGYATMYLWNWLMPELFHLPLITFWQAIGLLILSRLLFGFGGHHKAMANHHYRNHLKEKWEKSNPEEREQFFRRFNSCCKTDTASSANANEKKEE